MKATIGIATIPARRGIGSAQILSKFTSTSDLNNTPQRTRRMRPRTKSGICIGFSCGIFGSLSLLWVSPAANRMKTAA